jgi:hypothetical protein
LGVAGGPGWLIAEGGSAGGVAGAAAAGSPVAVLSGSGLAGLVASLDLGGVHRDGEAEFGGFGRGGVVHFVFSPGVGECGGSPGLVNRVLRWARGRGCG